MTRRALLLAPLVLTGLVSAGCTLIDQRTFDPEAGRAPAAAAVAAPAPPAPAPRPGPQPLVTIPLDPAVAYDAPLHDAVAIALGRGRRMFDVRTAVPAGGSADATDAATRSAGLVAARVVRLIQAQGGRATLSAEADAGLAGRTVLVFVR